MSRTRWDESYNKILCMKWLVMGRKWTELKWFGHKNQLILKPWRNSIIISLFQNELYLTSRCQKNKINPFDGVYYKYWCKQAVPKSLALSQIEKKTQKTEAAQEQDTQEALVDTENQTCGIDLGQARTHNHKDKTWQGQISPWIWHESRDKPDLWTPPAGDNRIIRSAT
jgi:hypothetical protein